MRRAAGGLGRQTTAEVLAYWRGRVDLEVFCYTPDEIATHRRDIGLVTQALKEGRRI